MLVAFPRLVGAHRGSGVEQELCQPLTALQLEVPSSQWDDSVGIKPSPLTVLWSLQWQFTAGGPSDLASPCCYNTTVLPDRKRESLACSATDTLSNQAGCYPAEASFPCG